MTEILLEQLAKATGWARDDPRLSQFLYLLSEWQISNPTVAEARTQLEQNPSLAQVSNLISFESATVSGGVTIGDVAGGNLVKLVLQQGIFITLSQPEESTHKRIEEEHILKAMMTDHSRFLHDRLSSFVGREQELEELRHKITTMLSRGGYLMITGQAGQGKSSILAKLVDEYDPEETAYHFIPIKPGPDYQVSLLRDLMARLILKHHLNDLYVTSVSRLALRDYFPNVLREVAANGKQEVIFIDGLDQLREDEDGERDLSFLPNNPPEGIVLVLGTRPNDTLRPLELLNSHDTYYLPNISQHDFNLMLQFRHVQLDKTLVGKFYAAMQQNALYLEPGSAGAISRRGSSTRRDYSAGC